MQEFKKVKASKLSLSHRRPVYGVGINDADYMTNPKVNGSTRMCPVYQRWSSMLQRCYSKKYQEKQPTYIGCSVCKEWLTFSDFARWHESNSVDEWELDKDVKVIGNKVYSPKTCLFIPKCINLLLNGCGASRGLYPKGVHFFKPGKNFIAKISIDGKRKHLGYFSTAGEAHSAYVKAKNAEIMRKCVQYPQFAEYLVNHLEE